MASEDMHRLIKRVFDKNPKGFMIDNVIVKRKVGLYYRVEEKVLIVG